MDEFGNVFSQFGEDEIIAKLLKCLESANLLDRWVCEFGAWDGLHFSNTANLLFNSNFKAVLIEADPEKFQTLEKNMANLPVISINTFVELDGEKTLDKILSHTSIPRNFDLLSIDIDGADYWVFEGMQVFRPKLIVIEFNPTIPKEVSFINLRDITKNQGSSIKSICELAESKNYSVCGITTCNVFLVDNKYKGLFEEYILDAKNIPDPKMINRFWQTYDGEIHTESPLNLLWHNMLVSDSKIQVLPQVFRIFPPNMNRFRLFLFDQWKKFK